VLVVKFSLKQLIAYGMVIQAKREVLSALRLVLRLVLLSFVVMCSTVYVQSAFATENIVVRMFGTQLNGIGPHMQLWIDGVNAGEVDVTQTTYTDYTFPVTLPTSNNVNIDVVFTNDASMPGADRNLYVDSVVVRGKALFPTDSGVILDKGSGAAAFDGVNTIPGQGGIYWNGALRFSTTLSSVAMTLENVLVKMSGTFSNGIAPYMRLWIDGVNVGAVSVTQITATDYTFPVLLPISGNVKIDVEFTNDACCTGGDRNLYVYSVFVRGKTLLPTDPGVIVDKGSGATAFDGVDTIPGQAGVYWNGALRFATVLSPVGVASFYMNEASWSGATGEVIDSVGSYSGAAASLAAIKPSTSNVNPAISGSPGTCKYGIFNRANKDYIALPSGFPNLGDDGQAFTITAWIKTTNNTQTGQRVIVDDEHNNGGYGFSLGDGGAGKLRFFSRGTPSALILDTANVVANDTWYFVAAVIDVPNKTKHIYAYNQSGTQLAHVSATWTEGSFGSDAGIASIGGETNASGEKTSAFGFSGNIDELNIFNGALSSTDLDIIRLQTHICPNSNAIPANFNCTVVGGASNTGHLYTQVAGTAFSIDVVALKADGTAETGYVASGTKDVTLEFVNGAGATACASRSALSPAVAQTIKFSATDSGRKTVSTNIAKAYRDLRCRVVDANQSPSVIGCSTDDFAVRPTALTITSANANADASGVSTIAAPIIKAGASFSLTAVSGVVGYDGTPAIDLSKLSAHAGAVQTGNLSGAFATANAATGNATGTGFTYNEVGYFRLGANGVYDNTFTAVDTANGDCATGFTASGGKNACSFGNTTTTNFFGRFIPEHFAIAAGTTTPACGVSFSYFGQDGFTTDFTLIAQNASNATTQNYSGSFAKLGLTSWSNFNFTSATLPVGSSLSASTTLPSGSWSNGIASVSAKHQVSRPSSATAPTNITVSAAPVDSDGVTMSSAALSSASQFRYGRLVMPNTYGSELLPLSVPIEAQYWNGIAFQKNQLDSCTVVPASSIAMGNYKRNLAACETQLSITSAMTSGKAMALLTAPGAGNEGSVDLSVNLSGASGTTCNSATASSATAAAIPWFGNNNPSARAAFGIYKSPVIYLRENF
jgi:MSHA biogenesis protein MshQ